MATPIAHALGHMSIGGNLFEITLGPIGLFVHAENLLNKRQNKYVSLLLHQGGANGQRTVDA